MASSSSSSDLYYIVDEFYFSALHDEDELFPISDEKYAEELQLQEALIQSSTPIPFAASHASSSSSSAAAAASSKSSKLPLELFCDICCDQKTESDMFQNSNECGHLFCSDCIRKHVAEKIKMNITMVTCPDPNCKGVIGPEVCRSFIPKEVLERWEDTLCESVIMGSEKFYCPFKDCSAMLVDDGGETVTSCECPYCNRLFCAQCKVAWHSGLACTEFKNLKEGERDPNDIMLMDLAKKKRWMRCPRCKFYVGKTDGCQHISCRCGYHFCYGCGKEHNSSHVCASV